MLRGHPTTPDRPGIGESGEWERANGTLIHHAAPRAIGTLPVAMVKSTFRTLLVTPARNTETGAPCVAATRRRAVDVPTIAGWTDGEGLGARSARAHPKRRLHEAAAPSARPRPSAALSGRMSGDWFGLPQRRVGHEGLEVALQALTRHSAAHTLSQPCRAGLDGVPTDSSSVSDQSLKLGGPILASNPGSILASAEAPRAH